MKETSPELPYTDRLRSWARTKAHGGTHRSTRRPSEPDTVPVTDPAGPSRQTTLTGSTTPTPTNTIDSKHAVLGSPDSTHGPFKTAPATPGTGAGGRRGPPPGPPPQAPGQGSVIEEAMPDEKTAYHQKNIFVRLLLTTRAILLHSKLNMLLVFVPIGVVVKLVGMEPRIVFAMNAIAIIPLAGLLSHATETVARRLGDTIGALLNVTFGNAVELIIFIALVKNEIRIVQASLLGSILANLLLILGMAFMLGGLRFREQIYNSTVTQMSACLLSLSVISLVLPTAFHASFNDPHLADAQSLKISRGTSVILLLVYIVYLLFQLKSHAYMYESTPQHIIDEEAAAGPVAAWLESSSSDDSSSSSSDSDDSGHSRDTVSKRVKRVIRGGRRRKNSVISVDTNEAGPTRTPSFGTADVSPIHDDHHSDESTSRRRPRFPTATSSLDGNEDAIEDDKPRRFRRHRHRRSARRHHRHVRKALHSASEEFGPGEETIDENTVVGSKTNPLNGEPRRVDFAVSDVVSQTAGTTELVTAKRPFIGLRGMSIRPVAKSLAPTVFVQPADMSLPAVPAGPVPRVRYGIRRTNSLPDRLNQMYRAPGAMMPSQIPLAAINTGAAAKSAKAEDHDDLSRTSAVFLLLVSTGLVALCAEFMVDSIQGLVASSPIGEIFIGLIILPIVGNAAEHVTAITVAMKNKMDLAIGVAVGSSIQIALFITPLVVIIGWIIEREMTLYFTLFETVCLFVSTFIVNFLVLDGRSNYLEGALLCATYVIISLVAFFYPNVGDASVWGA